MERVLSDNGPAYKSRLWHQTCAEHGIAVKKICSRRAGARSLDLLAEQVRLIHLLGDLQCLLVSEHPMPDHPLDLGRLLVDLVCRVRGMLVRLFPHPFMGEQ